MRVSTAGGLRDTPWYFANIMLPNGIGFSMLKVSRGELHGGVDVLIGMDIITRGDFAISHANGSTVFSFRYPSLAEFDFVKEANAQAAKAKPVTPGASYFRRRK